MRRIILSGIAALSMLAGILSMTGTARADTFDELVMDENTGVAVTATVPVYEFEGLIIYTAIDQSNQEFALVPEGSGFYTLEFHVPDSNTGYSQCLTSAGSAGAQLYFSDCLVNPPSNTLWYYDTFTNGHHYFWNYADGYALALDGNDTSNGTRMIDWGVVNNAAYEEVHFLGT